jgi:hypothetical protein
MDAISFDELITSDWDCSRKRQVVPPAEVAPLVDLAVEVPGIEPGSFVALPGLLRAQLAMPLLGPSDHASESV